MLSKRVIVVAQEKALQKRLIAGALSAGGATQAFTDSLELPARIDADLVLYAVTERDDPQLGSLLARLPEEARLVPIIPTTQLDWMVELLGDPHVATVLVAEGLETSALSSSTSKLLYGDLFGLEKVLPWGIRVYSLLVGDYQEKSVAITAIGDFAQAMGVRRKYREQIEQCLDEMLMNALYDAPVDADGKPVFANVPVKERVLMRVEEKAYVQYACDGDRFAISVRDSFGTLHKKTVLTYLDKCLHAEGAAQIDRKTGGAGLGLYLIANSATQVFFHIFDETATEVVCTFDLAAPRSQLRSFGLFEERIETAARRALASGQVRTIPTRRGRRREDLTPRTRGGGVLLPVMMTFAVLLLMASVSLVAWPYVKQKAPAALLVQTEPAGAALFVDGRPRGQSPLKLEGLEAGRSYALRATMVGHKDDDQLVTAVAGESVVRLHLAAEAGTVTVESDPAGAKILVGGKDSGRVTPAPLELEFGKQLDVTLTKDGFLDRTLAVVGPRLGERTVYRATLPLAGNVAALTVEVSPPTANVSVDGLALEPPGALHDTFVKPGVRHKIKVTAPGFIDFREELEIGGGEHRTVKAVLVEGGVLQLKTNVAATVFIDNKAVGRAPLAALALAEGKHTLSLRSQRPLLDYSTSFEVQKGQTTEKQLSFGTVEVKAPGVVAHATDGAPGATEVTLPVGPRSLALTNNQTGEKQQRDVVVQPNTKVIIDSW